MEDWSFQDFYAKEYQPVLALARVLTGDRTRAEDVAHDAFTAALEAWDGLRNPSGWIRRVVANKARSDWRRRYTERRAITRLETAAGAGGDLPDETEEFWGMVRFLPRNQALAVSLFYLEDRPVSEIAGVIGCKESTARVHLTRGRRSLAKLLRVSE